MKADNESGFSLLELMMAALLTVGLMGAIFALANRNQQVFVTEFGVVDMNQNMRTAMDMITRDIQSAGMGLPRGVSNFAAIYYKDGTATDPNAPDEIMMLNGDPFAPVADVTEQAAGSSEFFLEPPADVTITGEGANQIFTYKDREGNPQQVYRSYENDSKIYIVYDDLHAMIFTMSRDAQTVAQGAKQLVSVQHNPTGFLNPPSVFGSVIDGSEPDYEDSRVAILGGSIGYRLNRNTGELERTEDLQTWFPVARGIIGFQIQYRVLARALNDSVKEKTTSIPGEDAIVDTGDGTNTPTSRRDIRSVIITIEAETPDVAPGNQSYRRIIQRFEVSPRNFNLLNNNNLKSQ
ncbi:MAG: hypothetical protein L0229_14930 [Blastocatellia bacterium]|nr:hypothetical protein [Blastocatellia bacterium]